MSNYLEEVKHEVATLKEERIESYKQYISDYIVPQLAVSVNPPTAIAENKDVSNSGIHLEAFVTWLQDSGFITKVNSTSIAISYKEDKD